MENYQWNEAYLRSELDDIRAQNAYHRQQTETFLVGLVTDLKGIDLKLTILMVVVVLFGSVIVTQNGVTSSRVNQMERRLDQNAKTETKDIETKILFGIFERRTRKVN